VKVKDYQDCYYEYSGKVSEIGRTLSLAALGLIWIFKLDDPNAIKLDPQLVKAALWIVLTLSLDLIQYVYLTYAWWFVSYRYEKKYGHDAENLRHSRWLPGIGEIIFFMKIATLSIGYWTLGGFLWGRLLVVSAP
jgi:preprotein translocase subunit Sec61beta